MLLANGSYNGKSYKKESISVDELIAGVKDTNISPYFRNNAVSITHPKDRVALDPLNNGRIRRRASVTVAANYNLVDKKGNRCNIRYFEHEHISDQNVPTYEPRRLSIFEDEAMVTGLDMQYDKEKAVFVLLNPANEDSPFHLVSSTSSFRIHDPAKDNKQRNDIEMELLDIHTEIRRMSKENPDELKRRAQGMKIGQEIISGIDFDDVPSVTVAMMELSRKVNPKEFNNAFKDATGTLTRGLIADAFRKQILEYTIENMEVIVKFKGTEMCRFTKNLDPTVGVLNYVSENDIRHWVKQLSTDVADVDAESKLKKNSNKG